MRSVLILIALCLMQVAFSSRFYWHDAVVNGGFEQTACPYGQICWYGQNGYQQHFVPGWIPKPLIEINYGHVYNSNFKGRVVELDVDKGYGEICIKQKLRLYPGTNRLNFDWGARQGLPFQTSRFFVRVNGRVIKRITPCDYDIHYESQNFELGYCPGESQLQFCTAGPTDGLGAIIDNVKLWTKVPY